MAEIVTIPCLRDNYAFLLHDPANGATAVIDVPEAAPIQAALDARGWSLSQIWLTHHHPDHIDGVPALQAATGARVVGAAADAHRLPPLDQALAEDDTITLGDLEARVLEVSGHTIGHIAFHVAAASAVFTGDSLMALGCGRLFEGSAADMWPSMLKLRALPGETIVCSGHEYTQSNARFALSLDPGNTALQDRSQRIDAARQAGEPTVPSLLEEEKKTNPFLRADDPGFAAALGLSDQDATAVFAEIRARKDRF
ncbi:MAG: hydroxyacylglutathione hydrolase [Pseudomonadota bacterium]